MKQYIDYFTYQKKLNNILTFHLFEKENYEEYIFDTNIYQKYLYTYQQVLKDFKEFIQNYPIHDSLELGILYTYFLLPNGIFSLFNNFSYFREYSLFEPKELLGSKIISGTGCCRHIAKNLIDILNVCGFEAYYLSTQLLDESDFHALVGLCFQNKKYVLDPTNRKIGYFIDEGYIMTENPITQSKKKIFRCCSYDSKKKQFLEQMLNINDIQGYYQKESFDKLESFFNIYADIAVLYYKNQQNFQNFKREEIENYQKIYKKMNNLFYYRKEE